MSRSEKASTWSIDPDLANKYRDHLSLLGLSRGGLHSVLSAFKYPDITWLQKVYGYSYLRLAYQAEILL